MIILGVIGWGFLTEHALVSWFLILHLLIVSKVRDGLRAKMAEKNNE
jgi:hypothetical protein